MKNFLSINQISKEDILSILSKAEKYKNQTFFKNKSLILNNINVLSLFYEMSTRTQLSFELASKNLSANYTHIHEQYSSFMKGEETLDMMKTIESMNIHFLILRHPQSNFFYWLASKNLKFTIINAGNGIQEHPSQALIDLLTIKENFCLSRKLNILFWGDVLHSRVFKSLFFLLQKFNFIISIFAPPTLMPMWLNSVLKNCKIVNDPSQALSEANIVYPLRMQIEKYSDSNFFKSKKNLFKLSHYTLSEKYLPFIKPDTIILHAGPMNKNIEITKQLSDHKNSKILNQVKNGTPIRMAILEFIYQKLFNNELLK